MLTRKDISGQSAGVSGNGILFFIVVLAIACFVAVLVVPRFKPATTAAKGIVFIGKNIEGYDEYRHEKTGMVFVLVPGGIFRMGSKESLDERPIHEVTVSRFLIGKYLVTQDVWQKITGNNPSDFKNGNNPVEFVSWNDCQSFCTDTGLRLPTEAEWEYAGTAGITTRYSWGDRVNGDYLWYADNAESKTHQVGQKKPNLFGLFDMNGNVCEWCQDWFGGYSWYAQTNPTGPSQGIYRIMRGGAWIQPASFARSSFRNCNVPDFKYNFIGFRCAISLD